MERQSVVSSNISSIGYDNGDSVLEVEFNNGAIYQYFDVPQHIHEEIMIAESIGGYLARNVKGHFRFSRV